MAPDFYRLVKGRAPESPRAGVPDPTSSIRTLADVPRFNARHRPHLQVAGFKHRNTTYAQFDEQTSRIAHALRSEGLRKSDGIAYLGSMSDEYLELFFGCAKAGIVVVPVSPCSTPSTASYILNNSRARALFVAPDLLDFAYEISLDLPEVRLIVATQEAETDWPSFSRWFGDRPATDPMTPVEPTDRALTLYFPEQARRPHGTPFTHQHLLEAGFSDPSQIARML